MIKVMTHNLNPSERIVLAIDTSDLTIADSLVKLACDFGAKYVKFGLEFATATSWKQCAELSEKHSVEWIADAKLDDIPNTTAKAIKNILNVSHPPYGITVHGKAGLETLRLAQQVAGKSIVFGVTELTAIPSLETNKRYGFSRNELVKRLAHEIVTSNVKGIVASGQELPNIKNDPRSKNLITLIPGVRSKDLESDDQQNTITPAQAIKSGADLIVIGRQITQANNPRDAYEKVIKEIEF